MHEEKIEHFVVQTNSRLRTACLLALQLFILPTIHLKLCFHKLENCYRLTLTYPTQFDTQILRTSQLHFVRRDHADYYYQGCAAMSDTGMSASLWCP